MSQTPEGKVKAKIKKLLDARKPVLYYFMPVPSGYGKQTVDFIGWYKGYPFAIEAKRMGKTATDRQEGVLEEMRVARAETFVISGLDDEQYAPLMQWLYRIDNRP